MIVLAFKTDKPEAEVYLYSDFQRLSSVKWLAHRELAETIHKQISKILTKTSISLEDVQGIICYKGPGSFTGLRIGLSVANALSYTQNIPIVATSGEDWLEQGIKELLAAKNDKIVLPEYGAPANITQPKK